MTSDPNMTISQAKDMMRPHLHEGVICPVCNQRAQMYSRSITSSMAMGLILLYNETQPDEWIHLENFLKGFNGTAASLRGDIPKLRFWNLLLPQDKGKDDGNPNSGYYKITDFGRLFAENKVKVMSHILLYNNRAFGWSKDSTEVTIVQCLKNKFKYEELIKHGR